MKNVILLEGEYINTPGVLTGWNSAWIKDIGCASAGDVCVCHADLKVTAKYICTYRYKSR